MAPKVLVVEDSNDLLEVYAEILREEGYELRTAASAEAAIAAAETFRPELVMTDINLPGMNGVELLRYFREAYPPPPPRMIAVSGFELARDAVLQLGAHAFVKKPLGVAELVETVRAALEDRPVSTPEQYEQVRARHRQTARTLASHSRDVFLKSPEVVAAIERLVRFVGAYFGGQATLLCPSDGVLLAQTGTHSSFAVLEGADGLPPLLGDVIESGASLLLPNAAAALGLGGRWTPPPGITSLVACRFAVDDQPIGALCVTHPEPKMFDGNDLSVLELLGQSLHVETDTQSLAHPTLLSNGMFSRGTLKAFLDYELGNASRRSESVSLVAVETFSDGWLTPPEHLTDLFGAARTALVQTRSNQFTLLQRGAADEVRRAGLDGLRHFADACSLHAGARIILDSPEPSHTSESLIAWLKSVLASALRGPAGTVVTVEGRRELTQL